MNNAIVSALFVLLANLPMLAAAQGARQGDAEIIQLERRQGIYDRWGYADAVRAGDRVYLSGVVVVPRGEGSDEERYRRGFEAAFATIEEILRQAGGSLDDIVDMTSYHTDLSQQIDIAVDLRKRLLAKPWPTWTAVATPRLVMEQAVSEIKVVAWIPIQSRDDGKKSAAGEAVLDE